LVVQKIKLVNFRNISEASLDFSESFNFIYGLNAQGKTNLLEALHFFSLGRSFRTPRRTDMIKFGMEYSYLSLSAKSDSGVSFDMEVGFDIGGSTKVKQNDRPLSGLSEIIGLIPSVIFSPEDIALVAGGPRNRRLYLDYTQSQVSAKFLSELKGFRRALKQRNALLKKISEGGSADGLEEWNRLYIESSINVVRGRLRCVDIVRERLRHIITGIMGEETDVSLKYRCSFDRGLATLEENMTDSINEVLESEKSRGYSLVGPQYDDLLITIEGNDARRYGSQGQKRVIAVSLKLAQALTIMEERAERPVVLLDDILSELDEEKVSRIKGMLEAEYQSFLASPDMRDFPEGLKDVALFRVSGGMIERVE